MEQVWLREGHLRSSKKAWTYGTSLAETLTEIVKGREDLRVECPVF